MTKLTVTEDSTEGVDSVFHPIIKEYGRSMFATLINAQQATATAEVLNIIVGRLQNEHGRTALAALIEAFNQLSAAYVAKMDWTPERIEACRKELQAVLQSAVLKPVSVLLDPTGRPIRH